MRPSRASVFGLAGIVGLSMAGVACENVNKLSELTGPTRNLAPTFSTIQRDIFLSGDSTGRGACVSCHTNQGHAPAGGLNLFANAYGELVNAPSRRKPGATQVIPGDPDNSYLIQKLEGAPGIVGLRMPRNGPPFLTDGQVQIIRRWIQLGAKND
jgi:hypothetical protein